MGGNLQFVDVDASRKFRSTQPLWLVKDVLCRECTDNQQRLLQDLAQLTDLSGSM